MKEHMIDKNGLIKKIVDPRLLETVAASLCWAEFTDTFKRTDDPMKYWANVKNREVYYVDAEKICRAMMNDEYVVVPVELTLDMINAGFEAKSGIRSEKGLRRLWRKMIGK